MSATSEQSSSAAPSRGLHIGLWVVQVLLAFAFGMAGSGKATQPITVLAERMTWVTAMPELMVRFIGTSEFLGAIGLVLPALTRIKPGLTALAGAGLTTVMTLAAVFHAIRGEYPGIVFNAILGGLAAFVAWGRWKKAPIQPR